jgi:hypothetical protein
VNLVPRSLTGTFNKNILRVDYPVDPIMDKQLLDCKSRARDHLKATFLVGGGFFFLSPDSMSFYLDKTVRIWLSIVENTTSIVESVFSKLLSKLAFNYRKLIFK